MAFRMLLLYLGLIAFLLFTAMPTSAETVSLSWDPAVIVATDMVPEGYILYRRVSTATTFTEIARTSAVVTTAIDTPAPGYTWYYMVRAFAGGTVSANSNSVSITISSGKIGTPRKLTVTVTGTR